MAVALAMAAAWHVATHEMLAFAAGGLALSMLDDLAVDFLFVVLVAVHADEKIASLSARDELGWMAIIVPAWDEADVIAPMLRAMVDRLDYPRFHIFVGVYPNDPATLDQVSRVDDPRISVAMCSRSGPTTKADCLNHLWRAVLAYEVDTCIRFRGIVLHDAEDVIDASELHLFDAYLSHLSMVQLPVIPLVDSGSRWVSGHYIDEFAEAHRKDIVVRGAIGAAVPSAGVACAIDRDTLGTLAGPGGSPFDPGSMTEDYELGIRITKLGGRGALIRCRDGNGKTIATREYFPATFDTAIRQKTRWLLGIALDGWDRIGWGTTLADRYMLLRDRKTVVSPLLIAAGYFAALMVAADRIIRWSIPVAHHFAPLAPSGSYLATILTVNATALCWRLGLRASFTGSVHGWREGVRAIPRTVVGNVINAVAAIAALRRYIRIRAGRETPRWDKTAHRFPEGETADMPIGRE